MVPLKNNVKGSIALTSLRDRSDTTKKKNANNKEAIVDNIAPLVEEDLEYEKALKERAKNWVHRLFEIKYGIKEENFKSHEEFLQALYKLQDEAFDNYMKFLVSHMTGMRFYVSAQAYKRTCVANWIKEHGYHNYEEMIKESIEEFRLADKEYEEQREWDLLEELYGSVKE